MTVEELVSKMTLEEKASLCSGKNFWFLKGVPRVGVPEFMVSDGPHGLRKQDLASDHLGVNESIKATCFPTSVGIAASFDRDVADKLGDALGKEAVAEHVSVVLGPAINMKRSPLCGRNFEYMSEDPYLAGELAASYINSVQKHNVGVSVKHFAANNQEKRRMSVSAEMDERTLREIYLAAFETAVKKANPWTLMCSYNKINGVYSSENEWMLSKVLRDEWGFKGYVMTDWGAIADRVTGLKAGIELEMPSSCGKNDKQIVKAVKDGTLEESVLDRAVERILKTQLKNLRAATDVVYDRDADHDIARRLAGKCMVLLKNDGILPLDKSKKYAFIGEFAKVPRFQGGGSSHINSSKFVGCWDAADGIDKVYAAGCGQKDELTEEALNEAVSAAKNADVAIVFVGLPDSFESEGYDRATMDMPQSHNRLVEKVAEANPNTVVVLHNGSPVTMPWLDKVKGVLEAYLGGQASGGAVYDILFGDVNPSAKLPETFPLALEDNPSHANFPGNPLTVEYREGLYIGYRYYDTAKKDVLFPFGFGLSYTTFEYSDLKLSTDVLAADGEVEVSFKIKNTGDRAGAEVAQIYVSDKESTAFRPVKELKGFEKVELEAGEEKTVSVTLGKRAFAFYNVDAQDWQVEAGEFTVMVGAGSRDIRLSAVLTAVGDATEISDRRADLPSYYSGEVASVGDAEFSALLGRELSPTTLPADCVLTEANCFLDAQHTKWGARINKLIRRVLKGNKELGDSDIMATMALETPFRAMKNMSGGVMDDRLLGGLLRILNGDKPLKGLFQIIGSCFGIPSRIKKGKVNEL